MNRSFCDNDNSLSIGYVSRKLKERKADMMAGICHVLLSSKVSTDVPGCGGRGGARGQGSKGMMVYCRDRNNLLKCDGWECLCRKSCECIGKGRL